MNFFQWLTVPILLLLTAREFVFLFRERRRIRILRFAVMLAAAVLILYPQAATSLARSVGIGRGTDLVVYAFMLATTGVLFHFYGRQFTMRRHLVELARREALRSPIAGQGVNQNQLPLDSTNIETPSSESSP